MARKLPFVVACFLAIYLIWGSTYLAVVLGLESIPPLMLMGIRSVAGGIILLTRDRSCLGLGLGQCSGVRIVVFPGLPWHPCLCAADGSVRHRSDCAGDDAVLDRSS